MSEENTVDTETQSLDDSITYEPMEIIEATQDLLPQMNVNLAEDNETKKIISDEKLVGVYDEILDNIRKDREEIDSMLSQFTDMVLNGGDATSSSKEALVNLVKIKLDTSDKMSKIADLMTRVRGTNTFPRYMANSQTNTIHMEGPPKKLSSSEKRALLEAESKKKENQ